MLAAGAGLERVVRPVHCVRCGARNRLRGHLHAANPCCGKCHAPLPAPTRWARIPAEIRASLSGPAAAAGLALLGLLVGMASTAGYLAWRGSPPPLAASGAGTWPADLAGEPGLPSQLPSELRLRAARVKPGVQRVFLSSRRLAPLAIDSAAGVHYYVRLEDADTGQLAMTIYVRGGQPFRTRVPLGAYRILYAIGDTWYGPGALFGPRTRRFRLDHTFDFTRRRGAYRGFAIRLGQQREPVHPGTAPVPAIEFQPPHVVRWTAPEASAAPWLAQTRARQEPGR